MSTTLEIQNQIKKSLSSKKLKNQIEILDFKKIKKIRIFRYENPVLTLFI